MVKAGKEQIKQYILKLISRYETKIVPKVVENFGISQSTAYNYVNELKRDGIITKDEKTAEYALVSVRTPFLYRNENLSEDRVFNKDIAPLLAGLDKHILSIWRYAFTEMMNNAIEHSGGEEIYVSVKTNPLETTMIVMDDGVGIFKNIQQYLLREKGEELPLDECVALLFSGKFTTAKSLHSGEGIFFTSHLMDQFLIYSDEETFSRSSFSDQQFQYKELGFENGTLVLMSLNNHSKKTTKEVFDRFSDVDEGFIKTQIPIAHMFPNGSPVSRSEARRLGELMLRFKEVDLDFSNVEEVGQAFCHELFIVWQERNPDILLKVCHANDDVQRMISRVKNTK
ncbi:MAG: DUF4325 domain-containing protein [Clostridia bacterium]|nr:DUF4325 domain-containing protein [Clostridia bacterium]